MEYNKMKKRLVTSVFTVALAGLVFGGTSIDGHATDIGSLPSVSGNEITGENNYIGVTELKVADGIVSFRINDESPLYYHIELEKDGERIGNFHWGDLSEHAGKVYDLHVFDEMDEYGSGDYKAKVLLYENEEENPVWESEYSDVFTYTVPEAQLPAPENVRWDDSQAGVLRWDRVEGAYGYNYDILDKDGVRIGKGWYYGNPENPSMDVSPYLEASGPYTAKVRALSGDFNAISHSEFVSVTYTELNNIVNGVDAKLNDCINEINSGEKSATEVVKELRESVKDDAGNFRISMQTSSEVRGKLQELERIYQEKTNVTQTIEVDETVMKKDGVTILGAALNADENADITFKISQASEEEKAAVDTDRYENVLVFNMDLMGEGLDSSKLDIPVWVTLSVPDWMDADRIKVLHFVSPGEEPEVYSSKDFKLNEDKTYLSMALWHFSTFAIVEESTEGWGEAEAEPEYEDEDSSDEDSSDEDDGAWVPLTPDEIRRYAVKGNEKVEYVPAATNSYAVIVENSLQGPMCFASFESVLRDFTIGRTYNIYPAGNKLGSANQSVRITLTIPKALQKEGRQFQMICVTPDGTPYVLNDLDQNPNTITIETNTFYAYALIYK